MVIPLQAGLILIYYLFFLGWSYDANAPDGKFFSFFLLDLHISVLPPKLLFYRVSLR